MSKVKYNKSKTYLLPLLSDLIKLNIKYLPYLHNTYMFDNTNEYENHFFIEHEFNYEDPEFIDYEKELINNDYFVKMIELENSVIYIFKFPEEYLHEYNCLANSKYSEFKDDAKIKILEFWSEIYGYNPKAMSFLVKLKQVLYKEDKLRKKLEEELNIKITNKSLELGEFVDFIDETIDIIKIYGKKITIK